MNVLVISHVHVLREALVEHLRREEGIAAWGAFSNETVEAAVAAAPPGLIVIDASHPGAAALVGAARAGSAKPSVVVLTMCERDEEFLAWANIGISGYLGPDTSARDLVATVRRTTAGEVVFPTRLSGLLLNGFSNRAHARASRAGVHVLTPREHEIVALLADGMSNKLIARRLNVALPTVKNHVHSILEKWKVQSRGEAAAYYRRQTQSVGSTGARPMATRATSVSQFGGSALRDGGIRHGVSAPFAAGAA